MPFSDLMKKFGPSDEEAPELPSNKAGSLEAFIQRHGNVTESYSFYGGSVELRFDKEEHRYYRVGELGNLTPVAGVTNTVSIKDKSFMLTPWAAKVAIQKMLRLIPTEMVDGVIRIKPLTFEEFTVLALEAKTAHKDKLDEAGDIGHMAHKCLEDSINYAMQNDPEKIVRALINVPTDELAANAAGSGLAWMLQHNVRWRETETKIYSREFDYAGTMDGLALCDSCNDKACCPTPFKDHLCLTDWKSSNHLNITYLFQVASYKKAKLEEFPDLGIKDIFILRLGKSEEEAGKFEPWHVTDEEYMEDFQGFLACLNLTRLVDSVEERMKSQKGSIRAIKKEQRETAKALRVEQEKLAKALKKAEDKRLREEEKLRIKAEAKAERERLKAQKGLEKAMPVLTAISKMLAVDCGVTAEEFPEGCRPGWDNTTQEEPCTSTEVEKSAVMKLDTTPQMAKISTENPTTPIQETPQPVATTLTEAPEYPSLTEEVKAILEPAKVQRPNNVAIYKEEALPLPYRLPME